MSATDFFSRRRVLLGDLHNHCGISYAHGSLEDALANARLQLDFVSVTGHAAWPDIAAKPMPGAAYMVSSISSMRRRRPSSTRSTGAETCFRRGSGAVSIGRIAMAEN